jgi:hypothetical protein
MGANYRWRALPPDEMPLPIFVRGVLDVSFLCNGQEVCDDIKVLSDLRARSRHGLRFFRLILRKTCIEAPRANPNNTFTVAVYRFCSVAALLRPHVDYNGTTREPVPISGQGRTRMR